MNDPASSAAMTLARLTGILKSVKQLNGQTRPLNKKIFKLLIF